jgi:hypothetical protein
MSHRRLALAGLALAHLAVAAGPAHAATTVSKVAGERNQRASSGAAVPTSSPTPVARSLGPSKRS